METGFWLAFCAVGTKSRALPTPGKCSATELGLWLATWQAPSQVLALLQRTKEKKGLLGAREEGGTREHSMSIVNRN